jgi:hypothetical protein
MRFKSSKIWKILTKNKNKLKLYEFWIHGSIQIHKRFFNSKDILLIKTFIKNNLEFNKIHESSEKKLSI